MYVVCRWNVRAAGLPGHVNFISGNPKKKSGMQKKLRAGQTLSLANI